MSGSARLLQPLWLVILVCVSSAVASVSGAAPATVSATVPVTEDKNHRYTLKLDVAQRILHVTAELQQPGMRITASAGRWNDIKRVSQCDGRAVERLSRRSFRVSGKCFTYQIELQPVQGRLPLSGFAPAWVSSPARFMWLPVDGLPVQVLFDTGGITVSLPWQKQGATAWRILPAARSGRSIAVFGAQQLELGLGQPAALLAGSVVDRDNLAHWLTLYLDALQELIDGHYSRELQVVVVAVNSGRSSPVPFGHVVREQGPSVRFYVDPAAEFEVLIDDWTAPHELAHLLLPYVDARWLSEGFASYYQNVLLARTGVYTPERAWHKLRERFARAGAEGRRATPASGASRLLTYLSGAALALRADLELRRRGSSLDEVLKQLAICCLPARRSWSDMELASKLDELAGMALVVPLVMAYRHQQGMPPTADLFTAPDEALRRQIMAPTGRLPR